jgi:hypothetical protein
VAQLIISLVSPSCHRFRLVVRTEVLFTSRVRLSWAETRGRPKVKLFFFFGKTACHFSKEWYSSTLHAEFSKEKPYAISISQNVFSDKTNQFFLFKAANNYEPIYCSNKTNFFSLIILEMQVLYWSHIFKRINFFKY